MQDSHVATATDAVREEYFTRQQGLQAVAASSIRRGAWILAVIVASTVLLVMLFLMRIGEHTSFGATSLLLALLVFWGIHVFFRYRHRASDASRRAAFYQQGLERIDGNWPGKGNTGVDFARDRHLYQGDLDVVGEGSLFELLATTRSDAGAERLAEFLLDPVIPAEARARQEAIKELRSAVALREEVEVLGKYRFHDCSRSRLHGWLDEPLIRTSKAIPVILALMSLLSLGSMAMSFAHLYSWAILASALGFLLAVQGAIALPLMHRMRARIEVLRTLANDVRVLRAGIELVARLNFRCAKLRTIADCCRGQDASSVIRALERLLTIIERKEDVILYGFSIWVAAGTQLVLAVERWRARHQEEFEHWLDAWAEFEAVSALAGYAYEHPDNAFPDLADGSANFEAREMGHPLLSDRTCVTNDIILDASTRFYVVSGSNMAGKSTLLRAIGLNAVLAAAGAPVCARQARIAVMTVCASISTGDSLRDGASKFLAEVERLRNSMARARQGEPVIFLVDEMLSGTNSRDRSIAAESMLKALVAAGAIGALSTHDLALTEIAERKGLRGCNFHMQSRNEDDPLDFDYRLRPGIATQTNGLAIVRMMGLPV